MHPELFTLPVLGIGVKTYGFFMMVGFLSAVWLAMRRAERVKADPDCVLDLSFLALIFGVGGARAFYVLHYWKVAFADAPNKLIAVIDIRQGGLEFLGGVLGALVAVMIYLPLKKKSIRLYLDILAPSLMWGLAFGRLGCFFNGCCFGGLCVAPDLPAGESAPHAAGQAVRQITMDSREPLYPWAVRFPYGSPAHFDAWEKRRVSVPAELIVPRPFGADLLPPNAFGLPVEKRAELQREDDALESRIDELRKAVASAKKSKSQDVETSESGGDEAGTGPPLLTVEELQNELLATRAERNKLRQEHFMDELARAQKFPSRKNPERITSESELQQLASQCLSPYVHPSQLYSSGHAIILSGLLSAVFYQRKRHGIVIGLVFILYPIGRILLELIRADNPHDALGLTISQFVSVAMFAAGLVYIFVLYKFLPQRAKT